MTEQPICQVKDLTTKLTQDGKVFTVVDKISFELKKGKTLALIGESGCGKSMTAYSMLRLLPTPPALPPTGEVIYKGCNLLTLSESKMRGIRGLKIAMIFQDPRRGFNPVYTVGSQILEVIETHLKLKGKAAYEKALKAMQDAMLDAPEKRMLEYPHQMSGGMLQRAMIAMAIVCEPDILIADEPTTALDVTIQAEILAMLRALQKKRGMAILLITHDMGVVAEMADDAVVMYATEKVESASVYDIFDMPQHPYTKALFAARDQTGLKKGRLATIQGNVPSITELPQGCHFYPRCPHATQKCKESKPPLFLTKEGHTAKCWLLEN